MWNKAPTTFFGCETPFEKAKAVVFGAPYDSTTSFRPGARFAPKAMRGDSYGLEGYSPYQSLDITDLPVHDGGDLDLPMGAPEHVIEQIEDYTALILDNEKIPVMIGGEHLVTLGAVRAAAARHNGLCIFHFDAHADLRDDYLGVKYSHACVMRRAWECLGNYRIFQFGIRSGDRTEFDFIQGHTYTRMFTLEGLEKRLMQADGAPIYLSVDLDVLDPSAFPGTGTPEAGGVSFTDLLRAVMGVAAQNVVAADICELSPPYDQSGISTATANKLLRELLIALASKQRRV